MGCRTNQARDKPLPYEVASLRLIKQAAPASFRAGPSTGSGQALRQALGKLRPLELHRISLKNILKFLDFSLISCFEQIGPSKMPTANSVRLESPVIISEEFPGTLPLALNRAINIPACSTLSFLIISTIYIWRKTVGRKKCQVYDE